MLSSLLTVLNLARESFARPFIVCFGLCLTGAQYRHGSGMISGSQNFTVTAETLTNITNNNITTPSVPSGIFSQFVLRRP
jgi:hypothetical protein